MRNELLGVASAAATSVAAHAQYPYHFCMQHGGRVVIDPAVRSGKPCIRGTRIAVSDVLDYLGGGMSIADVLEDFPDLTAEDVQACFAFAADRDRRLMVPNEAAIR